MTDNIIPGINPLCEYFFFFAELMPLAFFFVGIAHFIGGQYKLPDLSGSTFSDSFEYMYVETRDTSVVNHHTLTVSCFSLFGRFYSIEKSLNIYKIY